MIVVWFYPNVDIPDLHFNKASTFLNPWIKDHIWQLLALTLIVDL